MVGLPVVKMVGISFEMTVVVEVIVVVWVVVMEEKFGLFVAIIAVMAAGEVG